MNKESKVEPEDLIGIYSEMAQLIGAEAVTKIYVHFKGQQIAFPTRLYTKDYIVRQLNGGAYASLLPQLPILPLFMLP